MSWASSLTLSFDTVKRKDTVKSMAAIAKTRLSHRKHTGALMVQRALYPEPRGQQGICHILMLYPPAGIAGGDTLTIELHLDNGSHAVITTPGAGKWYGNDGVSQKHKARSDDNDTHQSMSQDKIAAYASQHLQAKLAAHVRLEWLPQESIIYNEANMHAVSRFDLADSSSLLTWEISVFGRQAYDEQFLQGRYHTGLNIYRDGKIIVTDRVKQAAQSRWFTSSLGLAGQHI